MELSRDPENDKKRLLEISNGLYYNNMRHYREKNQIKGHRMDNQHLVDHAINTGKVVGGGVGVGTSTYMTVAHLDIAQATAVAGLAAACMTALYFAVSAGYALWKWRKEANGS